jgi:hypothetical protein
LASRKSAEHQIGDFSTTLVGHWRSGRSIEAGTIYFGRLFCLFMVLPPRKKTKLLE